MQTPLLMGILNVTPDSFSDGGRYLEKDAALKQAEQLVQGGADILDIGGESTRPGAQPVSLQEELDRVIPVVEAVAKRFPVQISVDTYKPQVAKAAVEVGATILNDITAAKDIAMAQLAAEKKITIVLTHMQGTPQNMQTEPRYAEGVVTEVQRFLRSRVKALHELGVGLDKIWIDPGIGFGKTVHHNLDLLRHLEMLIGIGERLVIGTSRKSFLGGLLGEKNLPMDARNEGTLTTNLWAFSKGASVFRVHDVAGLKRVFSTWNAIRFGIS